MLELDSGSVEPFRKESVLGKSIRSRIRELVRAPFRSYRRRRLRLSRLHDDWSIGILSGPALESLAQPPGVQNPVLTWRDVTDRRAAFVADPFLIRKGGEWFLFFEVYNRLRERGEIAVATSIDGLKWEYGSVVLAEPFHLSYPYVFEWKGATYLIPESHEAGQVRLYRARDFPFAWEFVAPLLTGGTMVDPSILRYGDRWWLFVETNPEPRQWDTLRLYWADMLEGPWFEHPLSPVCDTPHAARPAGRIVSHAGKLIRFAQVCDPDYGTAVRAFDILKLSTDEYHEREISIGDILRPGVQAWKATGVHHIDLHQLRDGGWIAAVDGCGPRASGVRSALDDPAPSGVRVP